ncbi:hypothetical protein ES702_07399 [subsurface metagenome]
MCPGKESMNISLRIYDKKERNEMTDYKKSGRLVQALWSTTRWISRARSASRPFLPWRQYMKEEKLSKCLWCGEPIVLGQEDPREKNIHRLGLCFQEDKKKNPDIWRPIYPYKIEPKPTP